MLPRLVASPLPLVKPASQSQTTSTLSRTLRSISFKSFMGNSKEDDQAASSDPEKAQAEREQQQAHVQGSTSASAVDSSNSEEQAGTAQEESSDPHITELQQQLESAQSQAQDFKEKYVRSLAEMENVRERAKHQVQDAKDFGIQKFAKDMLEIADVLQLALDNVPEEAKSSGDNPALHDLYEGLLTTNKLLHHIFERHNLHVINPHGEKFDPNHHDALFEVPASENQESGTVGVVTKVGYSLNGRTIRPASVGVVAKS